MFFGLFLPLFYQDSTEPEEELTPDGFETVEEWKEHIESIL